MNNTTTTFYYHAGSSSLLYLPRTTCTFFASSLQGHRIPPPWLYHIPLWRGQPRHNSSPSVIKPTAQLFRFKARKDVHVPFHEGIFPAHEYIQEIERIVKMTFPDSARIRYLGDSIWRVRVKPVTFFTISATPYCDIKVFHEGKTLQISSNRLTLDFVGLYDQLKNIEIRFSLQGELTVANMNHLHRAKSQKVMFKGWVVARLHADLSFPFSVMPEPLVLQVGDGILDRILGVLEQALVTKIIKDYTHWCINRSGFITKLSSTSNE